MCLIEPICFEFGKASLGGAGSRDGDEKSFGFAEAGDVGLHECPKSAAQEISLVGFAYPAAGDESDAQCVKRRVNECAENDEFAGLSLTQLSNAGEVATLLDAAFAPESHRWADK